MYHQVDGFYFSQMIQNLLSNPPIMPLVASCLHVIEPSYITVLLKLS